MSRVETNQPLGTPVWIDLGVPDLEGALAFYGAAFGWEFEVGPPELGHDTLCRLDGRRVAAIMPNAEQGATDFWWQVYLATDDCDATVKRALAAGGEVVVAPDDG